MAEKPSRPQPQPIPPRPPSKMMPPYRPPMPPCPPCPPMKPHHPHHHHHHHPHMYPGPIHCDMRTLKQMYHHMKMCHHYEMEMFKHMMKHCMDKGGRHHHKRCGDSSSAYGYDSSSRCYDSSSSTPRYKYTDYADNNDHESASL